MRRVMRVSHSFWISFFAITGTAWAVPSDFHLGMESSLSRDVVKPSSFQIIKTGMNAEAENSKVDFELKMSLEHPKVNAFSAKNVFYEFKDANLTVGRKWMEWSSLDETWGLGAFNVLDSWDRLRSFSQGLTGIFIDSVNPSIGFHLFASYLAIPEITSNVVIENNRFAYYHPQAVTSGPQTFELLDRATPLGYHLIIPDLQKILLRPSVALSIDSQKSLDPFYTRFSLGYLPMNYFPVALQAKLSIDLDQIVVDLRPRLLSHFLYSADLVIDHGKNLKSGFSAVLDQIREEDSLPEDYTTAALGSTLYLSPWISLGNLQASYLWSDGGLGQDRGPYASPNHHLFSSRVLYRNAAQIKTRIREFTIKVLHEFSINANWISLDWKHQWTKNFSSLIGGDLLSAENTVASNGGAEFLSDLRALDRIIIGVNYVF